VWSWFPNQFEASDEDPDLLDKLTASEELSGIFNILMNVLRRILINRRPYLTEQTVIDRRRKHERVIDPVDSFWDEVVAEDSTKADSITKDDLYSRFGQCCNHKGLPTVSKEVFGMKIKNKEGILSAREGSGGRRTIWKGIRLRNYLKANDL
jgi:phage/plasmid-associated DNA primase